MRANLITHLCLDSLAGVVSATSNTSATEGTYKRAIPAPQNPHGVSASMALTRPQRQHVMPRSVSPSSSSRSAIER
jgi:hypothetical protein